MHTHSACVRKKKLSCSHRYMYDKSRVGYKIEFRGSWSMKGCVGHALKTHPIHAFQINFASGTAGKTVYLNSNAETMKSVRSA